MGSVRKKRQLAAAAEAALGAGGERERGPRGRGVVKPMRPVLITNSEDQVVGDKSHLPDAA